MLDLDVSLSDGIFVEAIATKFGFRVPVELYDLTINASLRVILRDFVPIYPCFRTVDVALTKPLELDFGFNVSFKQGAMGSYFSKR